MESYLDALIDYLSGYSGLGAIIFVLGDLGLGSPSGVGLPIAYVTPFGDTPKSRTGGVHGVDMDAYTVPILVIDDLHKYGDPTQVAGRAYFEQPGYRKLLQYAQTIRAALRADITLGGLVATQSITEIRYVRVVTGDNQIYRGVRVTVSAQQRRAR